MKFIFYILSLLYLFISCNSIEYQKQMLFLDKFTTYDSLIFPIPETVHTNLNTHVVGFKTNDTLCVVNFSSGKHDPHLYIYHIKQKKLIKSIEFPFNENIKDFILQDRYLYILVNNYIENRSFLYLYDLKSFSVIDSCLLFENKYKGYIYVNSLFIDKNVKNRIYFSLRAFKNPEVKFPLIGYYNLEKKEIRYLDLWYPFVKDPNNDLYFNNTPFVVNSKIFIAYTSTPYLSQFENDQLNTVKTTSKILDLHMNDKQDDIVIHNFEYIPDVNVITINRKEYFLRELIPDENLYGTNVSILSIFDKNLNCNGEQVLEFFRDRESFLQKVFTKKYNDTSNISCYVYNNVFKIKIGIFSVINKPTTHYFKSLDSLKQSLQLKNNETCNYTSTAADTLNISDRFCSLVKYLQQKDSALIKENLIVVSLNACPTCVKDFLDWYCNKFNLFSSQNCLLITYNSEVDLEKIKDISLKYNEFYKKMYKIERKNLLPYIKMNEPFIYLKQIHNCNAVKKRSYKTDEIETFKDEIKNSLKKQIIFIE